MASGGKRGAGERVLESRHVIALFLLMLVFSGIFFALGYVMGVKQYDSQVRAAGTGSHNLDSEIAPKQQMPAKKGVDAAPAANETDPATSGNSEWEFYGSNKTTRGEPRLQPASEPPSGTVTTASPGSSKPRVEMPPATPPPAPTKSGKGPLVAPQLPKGSIVLQVAALRRQDDALAIATSLQKKRFAAYVETPRKDKFYRVQVGPFRDQKAADAAKKGLEGEGFKAFIVKH